MEVEKIIQSKDSLGTCCNENLSDCEQQFANKYPAQLGEPEVEDCSTSDIPNSAEYPEIGKKRILVSDPVSMTKYFFDNFRLPMYSYLNACLRNGVLDSIVGDRILNRVINSSVCTFAGVSFWRFDRENFYADVDVELKLSTTSGVIQWRGFITHWCSFEDKFVAVIDELRHEVNREEEGCERLNKYLIPYFTNERIDLFAEEMWAEYSPSALDKAKHNAVQLANRMGLRVMFLRVYDHLDVEAVIFFTDGELLVYDEVICIDAQGNRSLTVVDKPVMKVIPAGTIVVNTDRGTYDYSQFCIYHECIHYELHYLFFRLQQLGNNDPRNMRTKEITIDENEVVDDPVFFMEKQANRGAYGLMMPATHMRMLVEATEKRIEKYKHQGEKYEIIGNSIRRNLDVPYFRVRARLIQLGYVEAKGAMNYVDSNFIKPFAFSLESLRHNENTFVISKQTMLDICRNEPALKDLLDEGKYVYIDGHIVRNDPKYVEFAGRKLVLTDVAISHLDDCCLRFTRQYIQKNLGKFIYGKMYYDPNYVTRTEFFLKDKINEKQMDIIDAKAEYKQEFPSEFKAACLMLIKQSNMTEEKIAEQIGTSDRTFREWLKDPVHKISPDFIIWIALVLQLPDWLSQLLLDSAYIKLSEKNRRHLALEHIRTVMWDCGVEKANEFLKTRGMEPLTI